MRIFSAAVVAFFVAAELVAAPGAQASSTPGRAGVEQAEQSRPLTLARRRKKRRKKNRPPPTPVEAQQETPAAAPQKPALPEPRPLPKSYRAIGLLPLSGIDVSEEMLHDFEILLLREIEETKGVRPITPTDLESDLTPVGLSVGACDGLAPCLAQAGRYAGAHAVLEARIAALGGTLNISMRLIDTESGSELGRVAEALPDDAQERAEVLHRYCVQLLTPQTYVGSLVVKSSQAGAEVYLDDKLVGKTPLKKPLKHLRAGPHILRVAKAGFSDLYQFVDVIYKRSSTISVDLSTTTVTGVIVEAESQSGHGELFVIADEPGIEIRIDGEPRGTTPLKKPIKGIPAGLRHVSLRKEGSAPVLTDVEVRAGQRTDVDVRRDKTGLGAQVYQVVLANAPLPNKKTVAARPPEPPPGIDKPARPMTWRMLAGIAGGGLGVVGLGVGTYFGLRAHALAADARRQVVGLEQQGGAYQCKDLGRTSCLQRTANLTRLNQQGAHAQTGFYIAMVSGAVLATAGGALLYWELYATPSPKDGVETPTAVPPVQASVSPLPGGARFDLRLAW